MSLVHFSSFPRTQPPTEAARQLVDVFRAHEAAIGTDHLEKGLLSDAVLEVIRPDLESLGFLVETGKSKAEKIFRPVFFGEDGVPAHHYEIDAYHQGWRCGLEVEAGRAWMGNAVYRDLVLAALMVDMDHFALAVPNQYKHSSGGRRVAHRDYESAVKLAETIYAHPRLQLPYSLTVIGY